jgi:hypothetical protein
MANPESDNEPVFNKLNCEEKQIVFTLFMIVLGIIMLILTYGNGTVFYMESSASNIETIYQSFK